LKTGAYGILRFVIPFFPDAAKDFQLIAFILGAAGILYGAMLAFAQTDLKRLVAYSSVSHMGFVLLGAFSFNELALQGTVIQLVAHGISTGALFILVGMLQERIHTRDLNVMGGLWAKVPFMGGMGLLFALASLGLPGLINFIAEFLVLAGAYQANIILTSVAALGLIASTIYSLRIVQKVFYGPQVKEWHLPDLNSREILIMACLTIVVVWLGLFPQQVFNLSKSSVGKILNRTEKVQTVDHKNNIMGNIRAEQ
jgi:NADH-quinone oxidoreductase subunit M